MSNEAAASAEDLLPLFFPFPFPFFCTFFTCLPETVVKIPSVKREFVFLLKNRGAKMKGVDLRIDGL
jgi:hypothetical protein